MGCTNSKVKEKQNIEQFVRSITCSFSLYKPARRKVFALIEQQTGRRFHLRYLWAFGSNNLVRPLNNMGRLIMKEIPSHMEQMWAYCTWKAILGIQMDKASDMKEKFKDGIEVIKKKLRTIPYLLCFLKGAAEMSVGKLDKMIADEEAHFLNLCRNAIVGLESQNILKKIQANKEAATDKNKRDQAEFIGNTLPDLSDVLPRVFESSVVLVSICFSKKTYKI